MTFQLPWHVQNCDFLIIFHVKATHTLTIFELCRWNQSQIYGIAYDNLFWHNIDFARNSAGFTIYGM